MNSLMLNQRFLDFVQENELFNSEDKLLLALSGGIDSIVLLHLLSQSNFNYSVAHVNYKLRGQESDADEDFVKDICQKYQIRYHIETFDLSQNTSQNTQLAAREGRYNFFKRLAHDPGYDKILTAHHLDDSLETFLINLSRGTGLAGLRGVPAKRGLYRRPLLFATRNEIINYAHDHSLVWREDQSNSSDKYLRNRIRHSVVPVMREYMPDISKTLPRSLFRLQQQYEFYQSQIDLVWQKCTEISGNGDLIIHKVELSRLASNALILEEKLTEYGFTPELCRQILSIHGRHSIQAIEYIADVSPATIIIRPLLSTDISQNVLIERDDLPIVVDFALGKVTLDMVDAPKKFGDDPSIQYLKILPSDYPLHLRVRQKGDIIQPLGMGGQHQRVSRLIRNMKVPPPLNKHVPVLTDFQGQVLAVIGLRTSENTRVVGENKVLRIHWKQTGPTDYILPMRPV